MPAPFRLPLFGLCLAVSAALMTAAAGGCEPAGGGDAEREKGTPPTVASLVPAATDLLIGMGAGDHLVAVSNFDTRPDAGHLARVGDYRSTDWEMLARIRPDVMVIQIDESKVPAGMRQR